MAEHAPLPSIAEVIGPVLQRVSADNRPLLVALAERLAAERYRGWAERAALPEQRAALLACAAREEDIAQRVEALYPDAPSRQRDILEQNPDLIELNRQLFAPYAVEQQYRLQAQGERVGAATWRAFAKQAPAPARDVFLSCALLEEQSADYLESIR